MKITIQYFDGCPHWTLAENRVREAMTDLGRKDVEIAYQRIDSPDDAEQFSFHGSPTILVNGRDLFAGREMPVSFGCRVYATEEGTQGAPSVSQLRQVLRAAT
jgi:hypothetical protein